MQIFLDAYAIIYWVEGTPFIFEKLTSTLSNIRKKHNHATFAASHLSMLECRVKPLRENNEELLDHYRHFFCADDLHLIAISPEILEKATELRANHRIRTPDAIQAASALSIQDNVIFVTGDSEFKKILDLNLLFL